MQDNRNNKINYIEIPVSDIDATKEFFSQLFAWQFTDFGPEYCSINNAGLDGGFFKSEHAGFSSITGPLVVFYYHDLDEIKAKIISLSGKVTKDIFPFPGGRRFHFTDINNNEFAIWSDKPE